MAVRMRFFSKTKNTAGWLSINIQDNGIYTAHIVRVPATRPKVTLASFFRIDRTEELALEKLAKATDAERYSCTNVLNPGEYQLLSVEAPNVPQDELKAAIRWRLKDMLDFHINDATIDVLDVPGDKNAPERKGVMYAVAAHEQLIKQRQILFEQAQIPLSVIDIPEMAQRNISVLCEPEGRGVALLSFDAKGGLLTITFAGELYLSRRFEVTLGHLMENDSEVISACYDRTTLELQRSFDHFDRQYQFISVAKLVLAPLGDAGAGLQAYLAANLYMPVESLNLNAVLDLSAVSQLQAIQQQQLYFTTLGAALRQEVTAL
jgi:MSHA biogenesis protein MshI